MKGNRNIVIKTLLILAISIICIANIRAYAINTTSTTPCLYRYSVNVANLDTAIDANSSNNQSTISYDASTNPASAEVPSTEAMGIDPNANEIATQPGAQPLIRLTRKTLSLLQIIGIAVALIMIIIIGIKWIVHAGDGDSKLKIKDVVRDFLFGAFCIFGATAILVMIQSLVKEFSSAVT